ncbi:MAG: hypothetical protein EBQ89_03760, partial [Alphaproteobacteria bacterium]|nr:hypothetical protein [Alphaproteobacteria bacterium]
MRAPLLPLLLCLLASCSLTGNDQPLDYRIMVVRHDDGTHHAIPPDCAGWRHVPLNGMNGQPAPNYGCADKRNLAAQVVDPRDVVRGRDPGPDSAEKAAASIERYLDDQVYGLYDHENPPEPIAPV